MKDDEMKWKRNSWDPIATSQSILIHIDDNTETHDNTQPLSPIVLYVK